MAALYATCFVFFAHMLLGTVFYEKGDPTLSALAFLSQPSAVIACLLSSC